LGLTSHPIRGAVFAGLQRILPLTLLLTFLMVPSTSTLIFKTFMCSRLEYNATTARRYLEEDLALDCDSVEYSRTRAIAVVFVVMWPLGVPLLYGVLLWASRDALRSGKPTTLSRATAFLSGDYVSSSFWWEPLEMCRKLALSSPLRLELRSFAQRPRLTGVWIPVMAAGWVLVIDEDDAEARVLVALLVSIIFLVMRVSSRPLKRCVATRIITTTLFGTLSFRHAFLFCRAIDGVLMTAVELSLVLIYMCVLLIKTCYKSTEVCAAYGFGDNGSGARGPDLCRSNPDL
jgi:hypothetical protein